MKEFFDTFEAELRAISEQLEILEDWHLAKGHTGASDIVDSLNGTITGAWFDFTKLREEYEKQEQSHETIVEQNMAYLLGELQGYVDRQPNQYNDWKTETTLFRYLDRYIRMVEPDQPVSQDYTIHWYLLRLIREDMQKQGMLPTPAPRYFKYIKQEEGTPCKN